MRSRVSSLKAAKNENSVWPRMASVGVRLLRDLRNDGRRSRIRNARLDFCQRRKIPNRQVPQLRACLHESAARA